MSDNTARSDRFDAVIAAYGSDSPCDNLIDLLADAMHWADHTGRDFHMAYVQACRHYLHELNDQQTDERRLP